MEPTVKFVRAEREALLQEIEGAFEGVSRKGGVSWSEAETQDAYGDPEIRKRARSNEHDGRWQDLVDDPEWTSGVGFWPYLDATGFRYYLPAAMLYAVRTGDDIASHLLEPSQGKQQWSTFDERQRHCVRRFLEYMLVVQACVPRPYEWNPARKALEDYWWNA